jgi:hypothetical protein
VSRASGIGSWPGTSVSEALAVVRDILAEDGLPYLPELPARGPGSDMVGRAAGLLVDLAVDLQPMGWRFVDRPGHDASRTASLWGEDLDELAEAFDGYTGELKLQVAGPWTLASSVWLHRAERAVVDQGATRDLVASLAEGVRVHLAEVQRLVPGAELVLQLDEPGLPAVLAGRLPTASGYGTLRAVDPQVAASGLRDVLAAADGRRTAIHCCAPDLNWPLLRGTGASALAVDTTLMGPRGWESAAATVESGVALWAGVLPTDGSETSVSGVLGPLVDRWREVGLPVADLDAVTVTPTCGLAGLTPEQARSVQAMAADTARALTETAGS